MIKRWYIIFWYLFFGKENNINKVDDRILINLEMYKMYVKVVFLNGDLKDEIYMK